MASSYIVRERDADPRGLNGWELVYRFSIDGVEIEERWGIYDEYKAALDAAKGRMEP